MVHPRKSRPELVAFLRHEMTRQGYNESQLAKRAGLARQTISNILAGRRTPDSLTCQKLAQALGYASSVLLALAGHETVAEVAVAQPFPALQLHPALSRAIQQAAHLPPEHQELMANVLDTLAADLAAFSRIEAA